MDIRRNPESGRQAVLWLATAFVILIGAAACAFIIVAAVEQPSQPLLIWGAIFGGFVMMLVLIAFRRGDRSSPGRWMLYWLTRGRSKPRHVLRIGRKPRVVKTEYGTNTPPTLDSVREAADQNVAWVPHGAPQDRPRPR